MPNEQKSGAGMNDHPRWTDRNDEISFAVEVHAVRRIIMSGQTVVVH
jgi:hypothetical protein